MAHRTQVSARVTILTRVVLAGVDNNARVGFYRRCRQNWNTLGRYFSLKRPVLPFSCALVPQTLDGLCSRRSVAAVACQCGRFQERLVAAMQLHFQELRESQSRPDCRGQDMCECSSDPRAAAVIETRRRTYLAWFGIHIFC